jgi:hypothetical protein
VVVPHITQRELYRMLDAARAAHDEISRTRDTPEHQEASLRRLAEDAQRARLVEEARDAEEGRP